MKQDKLIQLKFMYFHKMIRMQDYHWLLPIFNYLSVNSNLIFEFKLLINFSILTLILSAFLLTHLIFIFSSRLAFLSQPSFHHFILNQFANPIIYSEKINYLIVINLLKLMNLKFVITLINSPHLTYFSETYFLKICWTDDPIIGNLHWELSWRC